MGRGSGRGGVGSGGCGRLRECHNKITYPIPSKSEKVGVGWWGHVGDQVGAWVGRGSTNVNQELKVLLKEHKGILQLITVKNMKTGARNPLGLLKMRGNYM